MNSEAVENKSPASTDIESLRMTSGRDCAIKHVEDVNHAERQMRRFQRHARTQIQQCNPDRTIQNLTASLRAIYSRANQSQRRRTVSTLAKAMIRGSFTEPSRVSSERAMVVVRVDEEEKRVKRMAPSAGLGPELGLFRALPRDEFLYRHKHSATPHRLPFHCSVSPHQW